MKIAEHFESWGSKLGSMQIFTVGANPLPILVTARALRPETVWLLYTRDVEGCKRRLEGWLQKPFDEEGAAVRHVKAIELDARDPAAIVQVLGHHSEFRDSCHKAGLHYSGGTKVMAVQVYSFWQKNQGQIAQISSYLGSDGRLRFELPEETKELPLQDREDLQLSLDTLCDLHLGARPKETKSHPDGYLKTAQTIWSYVSQHGIAEYLRLLPPYYGTKSTISISQSDEKVDIKADYQAAAANNFCPGAPFKKWLIGRAIAEQCGIPDPSGKETIADIYRQLYSEALPSGSKTKDTDAAKKCVNLAKYLHGLWLEVWLADWLESAKGDDGRLLFHKVRQDIEVLPPDRSEPFQADVVALRGYTVYLFSCTVDTTKALVKSKLFEARQRADQLGGEHARCAVVSFSENPEKILAEIREQGWSGYDEARSFGSDHIRTADKPLSPLLQELKEWVKTS